jgi:hypothetical protein
LPLGIQYLLIPNYRKVGPNYFFTCYIFKISNFSSVNFVLFSSETSKSALVDDGGINFTAVTEEGELDEEVAYDDRG